MDYSMFRQAATAEDEQKLKNSRARVWPRVLVLIVILVLMLGICVGLIGWGKTIVAVAALAVVGVAVLLGYGSMHNLSDADLERAKTSLPGHDIIEEEDCRITAGKSFEFDCAPEDLWPYLAQMNQTKAGFYSFSIPERFFTFAIRNDYTIRPEWQDVKAGDWIFYHQNGAGTGVVDAKENEYLLSYSDTRYKPCHELAVAWRPKYLKGFAWTWNFILEPLDGGQRTKFLTYSQVWYPEDTPQWKVTAMMLEWGLASNFMTVQMTRKMGSLAEKDAKARRAGKARPVKHVLA